MKKLIIAALLGIVSVSAIGQVKKDNLFKNNTASIYKLNLNYHQTQSIQPAPKPWLQINNAFGRPDSVVLIMHNRKQAYWLNDSTLVIKKP